MRKLIITADDFGLAESVNEAVEVAHRDGILSAASLMVAAPAATDAIVRAQRLPSLGVGLHLVLVDGAPVLPAAEIPRLVGPDGQFFRDPLKVGVRLFFDRATQAQAEAEIRAQLERFRASGLALDHVNGHHHFHQHPTVTGILLRLAPEFGIKAIRVPIEPALIAWQAQREALFTRSLHWLLSAARLLRMPARLRAAGIRQNDYLLGLFNTGDMTGARIDRFLAHLPATGISELYVHPASARVADFAGLPQASARASEFAAITDPARRARLLAAGLYPVPFAGL